MRPLAGERIDEIFAVIEGLHDRPLTWDDQIIRQLIECIKVVGKDKLVIHFWWGDEVEANLK